jgi:metal-responsive CopG/Arc/MetJ family transcriptional regulator
MSQATAQRRETKHTASRVSVPVTDKLLEEIEVRATRAGVSRSSFLARLLQLGLESEQLRYEQFVGKIRQYRECADENEASRLGDEIGEMIFGR